MTEKLLESSKLNIHTMNYEKYFEEVTIVYPLLHDFYSQLFSCHGFNQIEDLCKQTNLDPQNFTKMRIIDIGGGTLYKDDSHEYSYYPWYAVCGGILGADVLNIDQPFARNHDQNSNFISLLKTLYTHFAFDLSRGLIKPHILIDKIKKDFPQYIGQTNIVHCHYVTSFSADRGIHSPVLEHSFGNTFNPKSLLQSSLGVFHIAEVLLKDGGYLHFNNLIFTKKGDKFLWIPQTHTIGEMKVPKSPIP